MLHSLKNLVCALYMGYNIVTQASSLQLPRGLAFYAIDIIGIQAA